MNEPPPTIPPEETVSARRAVSQTRAAADPGKATVTAPAANAAVSCLVPGPFDEAAVASAAKACREGLGCDPDLVLAFVSSDYRSAIKDFLETLAIDGRARRILGCSGGGLLGVGRELENQCGFSLLFLSLPATEIEIAAIGELLARRGASAADGLLLLAHPLRDDGRGWIPRLRSFASGVPVVGGFVVGGPKEEDLFLFASDGIRREDALVASLRGGVRIETLVAQSCRPIGRPLIVTGARGDEVISIGRRPALEVLEETFGDLHEEIRSLAEEGNVFAGVAAKEELEDYAAGDFLIRRIVSARLEDGRLRLGAEPRVGQTLQFQIREALAAEALSREAAEGARKRHGRPFAIVSFVGCGRGKALFGAEDRDARLLGEVFANAPLAGVQTHGEIGPAGGSVHRHDHSLCAALLCDEIAG